MRVLYLTQWFDPEPAQKGASFVRGLEAAGYDVQVCTGFPNYPGGRLYPGYRLRLFQRETIGGVRVDRVPLYPSHDGSSLRRGLNYLSFFLSALAYGLWRARRFDVIYVYHPPITVGVAAALVGWIRGAPFVLDIQDLWPDSIAVSGMPSTGRLARMLAPVCDFVYRRAAGVVAQSAGMRAKLVERGVPAGKLSTIFNWADESLLVPTGARPLTAYRFEGRFNLVYAGNLGRVQGLDTLIRAAEIAGREAPEIQLLLIGEGVESDRLRALARELGAANVRIHPAIPKDQIADVLAAADVLMVHLADDPLFEVTIPSKLQTYLAMGKPVLIAMTGEAARIVGEADAGVVVPPGRPMELAEAMVALSRTPGAERAAMGDRALRLYKERFSFATGIAATTRVLEGVG